MIAHRFIELQTAKGILAEIFRARPADIEDLILRRLVREAGAEATGMG